MHTANRLYPRWHTLFVYNFLMKASDPYQDCLYLLGRKRFLVPVTYFPTNLTGIKTFPKLKIVYKW